MALRPPVRAPSADAPAITPPMSPMATLTCRCDTSRRSHGTPGNRFSSRGLAARAQPAMVASSSASCTIQAASSPHVTVAGTLSTSAPFLRDTTQRCVSV
nr:hypothetical protein [Nonomuraea ceibae]